MMERTSIIAELAQYLGKTEEEARRFLQILERAFLVHLEEHPFFVRYLEQGFLRLEERDEALRKEMEQGFEALRKEMQQGDASLRKEMEQGFLRLEERDEALRREMQQGFDEMRRHIERLERWVLALWAPILVGIVLFLLQLFLKR